MPLTCVLFCIKARFWFNGMLCAGAVCDGCKYFLSPAVAEPPVYLVFLGGDSEGVEGGKDKGRV